MQRIMLFTFIFVSLIATQPVMADYLKTIPVFWKSLYSNGGTGLYCGTKFRRGDRTYNIEHVFPMSWVARSLKCGTRKECRATSAKFNQIEADMHNMFPAKKILNKARGSYPFSILKGERWVTKNCDFEIDQRKRKVEPRTQARGEIARAVLYMADRYKLQLRQRDMFRRWHKEDPPSTVEKRRNQRIAKIQGRENHWISRPKLSDR